MRKRVAPTQAKLCFAPPIPVGAHVADRFELERFGRIEEIGIVIPPRPREHYWNCLEYFERDHADPSLVFVATKHPKAWDWVGWNVRRHDQLVVIDGAHGCEMDIADLPYWEKRWAEEARKRED